MLNIVLSNHFKRDLKLLRNRGMDLLILFLSRTGSHADLFNL